MNLIICKIVKALASQEVLSKKMCQTSPCQVAVAVKTLKSGSSVEEKVDFLSEANMMKRFDHRNIVQLLGVRQST